MARGARSIAGLLLVGAMLSCDSQKGASGGLPAECRGVTHGQSGRSWSGARGASAETLLEEDGLPVFNLFLSGSLPDEDGYHVAWLVYRGSCHALKVRLRGDTSHFFPKRSFTLDFPKDAPFDEPLLADGFTGRHKVVLISPFNDNSYMRHRLAFELWRRMSPGHLQVKTYSAVVYMDGHYMGLYTVADHINKHLMAALGQDADGELFKAAGDDANFSRRAAEGEPKIDLDQGYEKKAGLPEAGPSANDGIRAFTAFVADASAEAFRAERAAWMEPTDYEDWWIFSTLIDGADSSSKNAYHYRARGPLGRWRYIPWDLDASLGQHWDTRRSDPTGRRDFTQKNHLFVRLLADPAIAEPMRERYRQLLRNELRIEVVLGIIDQYAREVGPAARRDEAYWHDDFRSFFRWRTRTDFTTHDEEVEYLRQWVRTRWSALEEQLP
jgi:spore coat protein CotH